MQHYTRNPLKHEAHQAFDWLWKNGGYKQRQAYRWLAKKMNYNQHRELHFQNINDPELLKKVIEICKVEKRRILEKRMHCW